MKTDTLDPPSWPQEESEAQLRKIIERNADGMLVVSAEGTIRFANPAAEILLDCGRDQLLGAPLGIPLIPSDFIELDLPGHGSVGKVAEMRVVEIDWEGHPAYLLSLRDVSDRKRIELEQRFLARAGTVLSRSLDLGKTLEAVADLAISSLADWCAIDLLEEDGVIARTELSREQARLGNPPLHHGDCRLVSPEGLLGLPQVLRSGRAGLFPRATEEVLRSLELAEPRTLLVAPTCRALIIVPLQAQGRTIGALSLAVQERPCLSDELTLAEDLAQRAAMAVENARLYRRAQDTEERLQLALVSARTTVWDWDLKRDHLVCSKNPFGGFSRGSLEDFLKRVPIEDHAAIEHGRAQAIAGDKAFHVDHRVLTGTGQVCWVSSKGQTYYNQDGEAERIIGVWVDVTERRELEEELRRRIEELAVADQRKNDWLAMLAHELRNPLFPVRNALQVLGLRGNDSATVAWVQETAVRQIKHLTSIIDDLLDVSRMTRGKVQLRRQSLDFAQLVAHTTSDHATSLEESRLRLQVDIAPEPVWVEGDPTRLSQVLDNLLTNARKFTEEGGLIRVELRTDVGAHCAILRVSDTGIGIPPQLVSTVFDPFVQEQQTIDRSRGGLGLGLALVKGLVDLHGGEVRVTSEGKGKGSCFSVQLPLIAAGATPSQGPLVSILPRRILIIEDNADGAESLRRVLETRGHEVRVAHNGRVGVDVARAWCPDVVFSDLGLPAMDGFEVARALRLEPALNRVVLIALSGYATAEDRHRSQQAGFDEHLAKPIEMEDLERALVRVRPSFRNDH